MTDEENTVETTENNGDGGSAKSAPEAKNDDKTGILELINKLIDKQDNLQKFVEDSINTRNKEFDDKLAMLVENGATIREGELDTSLTYDSDEARDIATGVKQIPDFSEIWKEI